MCLNTTNSYCTAISELLQRAVDVGKQH